MPALIVYDSIFGNTAQIAEAIADELKASEAVTLRPVAEASADDLDGISLLVLGSPTRGFRPTPAIQEFLGGCRAMRCRTCRRRPSTRGSISTRCIRRRCAGSSRWAAMPPTCRVTKLAEKGCTKAASRRAFPSWAPKARSRTARSSGRGPGRARFARQRVG